MGLYISSSEAAEGLGWDHVLIPSLMFPETFLCQGPGIQGAEPKETAALDELLSDTVDQSGMLARC